MWSERSSPDSTGSNRTGFISRPTGSSFLTGSNHSDRLQPLDWPLTLEAGSLTLETGSLVLAFVNGWPVEQEGARWRDGSQRSGGPGIVAAQVQALSRSNPPAGRLLATEAERLRIAARDLLEARAQEERLPEHALFALNRVLAAGSTRVQLVAGAAGPTTQERFDQGTPAIAPAELAFAPLAPGAPAAPAAPPVAALPLVVALAQLVPVARSAARLLSSADPARLRQCAAEDCVAWFLDTSKGGRRRWCSMERCGNRAKAARHRRKRGAAG